MVIHIRQRERERERERERVGVNVLVEKNWEHFCPLSFIDTNFKLLRLHRERDIEGNKMRLDSNIESKSSNYTYLNIIEIFNKVKISEKCKTSS